MTITLNADYDVTLNTALLGYVGETNARPVSVEGLTVDGADSQLSDMCKETVRRRVYFS